MGFSLSGLLSTIGKAAIGGVVGGPAGAVAAVSGGVPGLGGNGTRVTVGAGGRPRLVSGNGTTFTETNARRRAQTERAVSRPGEFSPSPTLTDKGCLQPILPLQTMEVADCPKGYVAVTLPDKSRVCMERGLAIRQRLWKPAPKPPVTAAEGKVLRKAARIDGKVERLVEARNKVVGDRKYVKQPTRRKG